MTQILVIDDAPDMREMLGQTLRTAGYEVVLASDGKEGVRLHRANPASLVITDLFMPNQEGLETIGELHRDFPQVPIIAICGYSGASDFLRIAEHLGASHTLAKPFQVHELLNIVKKALPSEPMNR